MDGRAPATGEAATGAAGPLWSALPLPALLLDAAGAILSANPAAEDFLNRSARALAGRGLPGLLPADLDLAGSVARVAASGAPIHVTEALLGPVGGREATPCSLVLSPAPELGGAVLAVITPRQFGGPDARRDRAKGAARSAIGMAEMLAHEIKNPLAGITGAAQLLEMSLDAADRELTELIVAESRRIVALLDQVEQFGNLRPPATRPVNLHDLLDRARRSAAVGFAGHMTLREDYDPSLPPASVDGDQMLQVLLNLMRNAAQAAGPGGGTITLRSFYDNSLRIRRPGGEVAKLPLQIEIVDDGPGLPPEIAGEVFEPFVSGRENGTGLGLALVGKIIADHGAWIAVESRPGRTVFRLSLPAAPADGAGRRES